MSLHVCLYACMYLCMHACREGMYTHTVTLAHTQAYYVSTGHVCMSALDKYVQVPGVWVYSGCPSLAPLPTAHCLHYLCVGSELHRGSCTTLSKGTLLPHCGYLASYLIALLCASGVTDLPYADCYTTAPSLLSLLGRPRMVS